MNLHRLSDIDKLFRLCYVKKKQNLYFMEYFMIQKIFFMLFAAAVFTGCTTTEEHREHRGRRSGHPAHEQKVTVSMDIAEAVPAPVPPKENRSYKKNQKNNQRPPVRERKSSQNRPQTRQVQDNRDRRPTAPQGFDRELNSVEQQHLQEVRRRNQQQKLDNERKVFGGFTDGLFKNK